MGFIRGRGERVRLLLLEISFCESVVSAIRAHRGVECRGMEVMIIEWDGTDRGE